MKSFERIEIVKKNPTYHHKFVTSSLKECDVLMKLKEEGYLITVIKNIEYSVAQYFKNTKQNLTIHSIECDGDNVNVSVYKNDEHDVIVIPKSLLTIGNYYEFSIGCKENPKTVKKDSNKRVLKHDSKKNVVYMEA